MATRLEIQAMIAGIGTGEPNTAAEMRILLTALLDPPSGTIIIKDVSNAYITANFDGTGLGINEEVGYAIVNGQNGTRNWGGRVPLAYGGSYITMGATGGSADAVVVSHTHDAGSYHTGSGTPIYTGVGLNSGSDTVYSSTNSTGVSGANKNMQPYIVTLITMKI